MTTAFTAPARSRLAGLSDGFFRLLDTLARNSRGFACAREVERLSAMSDAELARMGLTRDRIFQHAFGPLLH